MGRRQQMESIHISTDFRIEAKHPIAIALLWVSVLAATHRSMYSQGTVAEARDANTETFTTEHVIQISEIKLRLQYLASEVNSLFLRSHRHSTKILGNPGRRES